MNLSEAIEQLRERNEPVPKPMRLPTEQEVAAAEQRLGITLHPDFRRYLLEASDVVFGALEPATVIDESSHTNLISICESAWEMGVPRELTPICEDNADYYCIDNQGRIRFWSHNGTTDESWKNLATWIEDVWIGEN